ncbi:MAG: xanthine dehydrogenase family protein molybdopterin-binding subunit [Alphaproteobacteria bacterium]|nr:xanthine dehydrogenase family protein molybdopterin-binding subunit [Alphaproteobacteria bacterium]
MGRFGVGQSVRRVEDVRFLTGRGQYLEDLRLPGELCAHFVRSPHAHARIVSINTEAAAAEPGVVRIATGADFAAEKMGGMPNIAPMTGKGGSKQVTPPHPAFPVDAVRYVGEPVAVVIAETAAQARDAAELIEVEYESLSAVVSLDDALGKGAPLVWPEAPNNVSLDWEIGDKAATDAAFAKAAHLTRIELLNNRIVPNPIETRGAIASYDAAEDKLTLYTGTQGGHKLRAKLSHDVFDFPESKLRVVTPDVGGGFGMKIYLYSEQVAVVWAAKTLKRPVRWIGERGEAFLGDAQARDQKTVAELALDKDGRFAGLRVRTLANLGAYMSMYGAYIPTMAGHLILPSVYRWGALYAEVKAIFTNTVPVDAYRGAGKPETNFIVERLIDTAARETKREPAELRRLNFIPQNDLPYTTLTNHRIDSGAFEHSLDQVLDADTVQRSDETSTMSVAADGSVTVMVGTQSNGQGHETAYAQIVAERLGVDIDKIKLVQGDTDLVKAGNGTGGSRSLHAGGGAIHFASEKIVEKGKRIAAHLLEAAEADLGFDDGRFTIVGTDRSVSFKDVAAAAFNPAKLPKGMETGFDETAVYQPAAHTFPNGVHVCETEVDPETGIVTLERYTIVDDFGVLVNPMLVEGQIHGGVAQGIGQALLEGAVYDSDGQMLTGSFMDYCMPRADDLPYFDVSYNNQPCTTNPLGVKGCGEAGSIVAPSVVVNAIVDALAPLGVRHVEMPTTPERVWRAIQDAKSNPTSRKNGTSA